MDEVYTSVLFIYTGFWRWSGRGPSWT